MTLRRRVLLTSLAIAIPATVIVTYPVERMRTRDLQVALDRVVRSQLNDATRERCESEPNWFLTGPLEGRPPKGQAPIDPNSDAMPPRPKVSTQPFELFGYDEDFLASSSAAPRFPPDFKVALRTSSNPVSGTFQNASVTGVQMAIPTGWVNTPCTFLLGRLQTTPGDWSDRLWFMTLVFGVSFAVGMAALSEVTWRVRKLARDARQSAHAGYATIAPDRLRDELSSLAFVFNDAAKELSLRTTRIDDQDEALKRFMQSTEDDVVAPLETLESELAALELGAGASGDARVRQALTRAHDLSARVENLTTAMRLRAAGADAARPADLSALVARVVARQAGVAQAAGVSVHLSPPGGAPIVIEADERLLARAVANLVDNAVRYNRSGGEVIVLLARAANEGRFRLSIADNGPGVSEEEFRGLTAIRRFRGDEHRIRRPGQPGLGLAIAREVCDRLGFTLDLKRPGAGGFEAEIGGPMAPAGSNPARDPRPA